MQHQTGDRPDFDQAKSELSDKIEQGKRTATEAIHDARDEISRKAGEYAGEAKAALFEQAERTQRDIGSNMKASEARCERQVSILRTLINALLRSLFSMLRRLGTAVVFFKRQAFSRVLGEYGRLARTTPAL